MSGLVPNKFFKGRNSDGSRFSAEEWDYADIATLDAMKFVIYLLIGCVFSAITPILLTLLSVVTYNGRAKVFYIITILSSAYFLWDANHGWLGITVVSWIISESAINALMGIITACLVLNIIFLVAGGIMYDIINSISKSTRICWMVFLAIIGLVGFITFGAVKTKYNHQKGWVQAKINDGLEFTKNTNDSIQDQEPG